jgi:hypothetical protein
MIAQARKDDLLLHIHPPTHNTTSSTTTTTTHEINLDTRHTRPSLPNPWSNSNYTTSTNR